MSPFGTILLTAVLLASTASPLPVQSRPRTAPPPTPEEASKASSPRPAASVGAIPGLLAADSKPVQVAGGFRFTEGPAADASGQLFFVDVPTSRILTLASAELDPAKARDNGKDFLVNNGNCFGLTFDAKDRLFAAQGSARGAGLIEVDRTKREFTKLSPTIDIDGQPTPVVKTNDLTADSHGGLYFTDPSLARPPSPTRGVIYRAADGSARRVESTIAAPNGVRLSPDGAWLYVLCYTDSGVYRCPVSGPGVVGKAERFAELVVANGTRPGGRGDGLAIDTQGNLWCTNPDVSEIQVVSPAGEILGRVSVAEPPSNCAFGGSDGKTLYITAVSSVYALRTEVVGFWLARAAAAEKPNTEKTGTEKPGTVSSTTAPTPAGR